MYSYLFQLGHQPHISAAEIKTVFSQLMIKPKTWGHVQQFLLVETSVALDHENLIKRLGGTVKISMQVKHDDIKKYLLETFSDDKKIIFSISGQNNKPIALETKKKLKAQGRSVRYIEQKNTATVLHNKLIEKQSDLTIWNKKIFVTLAIQPFEEFAQRDFGRPQSDDKSGMLPPKLAKIMINLGQAKINHVILDPFCGSGTVLTEALAMGYINVIGSDIDQKAIQATRENIDWLVNMYRLQKVNYDIIQQPAQEIDKKIKPNSIDCIVSEPYLGKPKTGKESEAMLRQQCKELGFLYIKSFEAFSRIIKPNSCIVFIIPQFHHDKKWIKVECVNQIKALGFDTIPLSKEDDHLLYHRPDQHLGRQIWLFKKAG